MEELEELKQRHCQFSEDRSWDKSHFSRKFFIVFITISDKHFDAHGCANAAGGRMPRAAQWLTEEESAIIRGDKLEAVRMEIADIQIYLIRIADKLNVDLLDAVEKKIEINKQKYLEDKVKGQHKKYTEYE